MEADLRARVGALESWRVGRDIESARHDERWAHLESRFNRVEKGLTDINATLVWVMRIVIGAVIAAGLALIFRGGLPL
jgi:hypothetical protein